MLGVPPINKVAQDGKYQLTNKILLRPVLKVEFIQRFPGLQWSKRRNTTPVGPATSFCKSQSIRCWPDRSAGAFCFAKHYTVYC